MLYRCLTEIAKNRRSKEARLLQSDAAAFSFIAADFLPPSMSTTFEAGSNVSDDSQVCA